MLYSAKFPFTSFGAVYTTYGRGGIAIGAHVFYAEGLQFESDSRPSRNGRSPLNQQRIGTWWQHWGDKKVF